MNSIEKLVRLFAEFPGIGPKQARRFVYFLIRKNQAYIDEFKNEIIELRSEIQSCNDCRRYFSKNQNKKLVCNICGDESRDTTSLLVVSRDIDLENIEKSHSFNGKYFVLGGVVPILDKFPEQKIRLNDLLNYVKKLIPLGLKEIILGLDANSEGEYTSNLLKENLLGILPENFKISELGRGLSTGSELEYADPETIKNALKHRG